MIVPMRAIFVLAAILSFATPQVSWGPIEQSLSSSGAIVLSSPAAAGSQLSRVIAKSDRVPGHAGPIEIEFVALFPPIGSIDCVAAQTCDVPHLDLEGPPLAPRPPPL
jgi:hypothetical protein